jgi:putative flippase GtrA
MAIEPPHITHYSGRAFARVGRALSRLIDGENRGRLLRWFSAGLALIGINTVLLFVLVDLLKLSGPIATLVAAEACTLLRFAANHYWVFGRRNPTLRHCVQYHVANAGAFVVWWVTANLLTIFGMHYLLAGVAAVACSALFNLLTNFLWIWGKRH